MKSPEVTTPSEEFVFFDGSEAYVVTGNIPAIDTPLAQDRRHIDTHVIATAIREAIEANTRETPPVNEVEAMARLYGKYGVTAATMASAAVSNEIYTISMDKPIYND